MNFPTDRNNMTLPPPHKGLSVEKVRGGTVINQAIIIALMYYQAYTPDDSGSNVQKPDLRFEYRDDSSKKHDNKLN